MHTISRSPPICVVCRALFLYWQTALRLPGGDKGLMHCTVNRDVCLEPVFHFQVFISMFFLLNRKYDARKIKIIKEDQRVQKNQKAFLIRKTSAVNHALRRTTL